MGRKNSVATFEDIRKAVAYLRRSRLRAASDVFALPAQAEHELERLSKLLSPLNEADAAGAFSSWMEMYLTESGRVRLLGALRRQRADAKPTRQRSRTISLSPAVYRELERLSKATGGVPLPRLLESLAAIANVDNELQSKLLKLAVALSLK